MYYFHYLLLSCLILQDVFNKEPSCPYISQVVQRDCGVAALAMILKHYGSSYSLAYLRELAQTSREGTSALGLVEAGKQLGFETQAIRADLDLFK